MKPQSFTFLLFCLSCFPDALQIENQLWSVAISVHWHGIFQKGTPFMDGTGWITQCPIQPGQSFRHNFTAEPGGTFWYHSHVGAQRTDGLLGAFVVRDEQYHYTMAGEAPFVMVLQDWYHHPSTTVAFGGFGPNNFFNGPSEKAFFPKSIDGFYSGEAVFISALINGKGRMVSANGTDNSAPLTEFNVTSGKTYAFRVVGAQFVYAMRVSVDDHQITVTSTDGSPIQPLQVGSFIVNPGERFDFNITTKTGLSGGKGSFWIRAEVITDEWNDTTLASLCPPTLRDSYISQGFYQTCPFQNKALAILRYTDVSEYAEPQTEAKKCTNEEKCTVLNCPFKSFPTSYFTECVSLSSLVGKLPELRNTVPSSTPNQTINLNYGFSGGATINGKMFAIPAAPVLSQSLDEAMPSRCTENCNNSNEPGCRCTHFVNLTRGAVVDMFWTSMGNDAANTFPHPIHMHGHNFEILAMGFADQTVTSTTALHKKVSQSINDPTSPFACDNPPSCSRINRRQNIKIVPNPNPTRKDTIAVPAGGYVWIRLLADNPGWWFSHCHTEQHQLTGMAMIFLEDPDLANHPKLPADFPTCHSFPRLVGTSRPPTNNITPLPGNGDSNGNESIIIGVASAIAFVACCISAVGGYFYGRKKERQEIDFSRLKE